MTYKHSRNPTLLLGEVIERREIAGRKERGPCFYIIDFMPEYKP